MALQMKLDELEAAEVNIKVSYTVLFTLTEWSLYIRSVCRESDFVNSYYILLYMFSNKQVTE